MLGAARARRWRIEQRWRAVSCRRWRALRGALAAKPARPSHQPAVNRRRAAAGLRWLVRPPHIRKARIDGKKYLGRGAPAAAAPVGGERWRLL